MATTTKQPTRKRKQDKPDNSEVQERDPNEVLSLSALAPVRPYISIDDERHFLKLSQDFGLIDRQELDRSTSEYEKLWDRGQEKKLTRNESNRLDVLQDWLFEHVLVKPEKMREQLDGRDDPLTGLPLLSWGLKREVVRAFIEAPWRIAMAQQIKEQATEPADSSTEPN